MKWQNTFEAFFSANVTIQFRKANIFFSSTVILKRKSVWTKKLLSGSVTGASTAVSSVNSTIFFFQAENDTLRKTQSQLQSQLDASLAAQEQQRKVLEAINRQFGDHLAQLGQLQNELTAVLNT